MIEAAELIKHEYISEREPYKETSRFDFKYAINDRRSGSNIENFKKVEFFQEIENFRKALLFKNEPKRILIKDQEFTLSSKLGYLKQVILESEDLLELEEDWDEHGANATNIETFKKAIDFIIIYSQTVLENSGLRLAIPAIDITRDGSVSAHWDTIKGSFYIIFKKDAKEYAYYYGQEKGDGINIPFKYRVKINEPLNEITLAWMLQNLT